MKAEEEVELSYELKKLQQLIELQTLDLESTVQYILKKHTLGQIKEVFSNAYSIFNEAEPIYRFLRVSCLYESGKKILNCFGSIYVLLMEQIEQGTHSSLSRVTPSFDPPTKSLVQETPQFTCPPSLGGISLYNECYRRGVEGGERSIVEEAKPKSEKERLREEVENELGENYMGSMPTQDELSAAMGLRGAPLESLPAANLHEDLEALACFFKESQEEAFAFLNKTKHYNQYVSYAQDFEDVLSSFRKEKESSVSSFMVRVRAAFCLLQTKYRAHTAQLQAKIHLIQANVPILPQLAQAATQTMQNYDHQIAVLLRRNQELERNLKILQEFKKEEFQHITLQLNYTEGELASKTIALFNLQSDMHQHKVSLETANRRIKELSEALKTGIKRNKKSIIAYESEETNQAEAMNLPFLQETSKRRSSWKKKPLDRRTLANAILMEGRKSEKRNPLFNVAQQIQLHQEHSNSIITVLQQTQNKALFNTLANDHNQSPNIQSIQSFKEVTKNKNKSTLQEKQLQSANRKSQFHPKKQIVQNKKQQKQQMRTSLLKDLNQNEKLKRKSNMNGKLKKQIQNKSTIRSSKKSLMKSQNSLANRSSYMASEEIESTSVIESNKKIKQEMEETNKQQHLSQNSSSIQEINSETVSQNDISSKYLQNIEQRLKELQQIAIVSAHKDTNKLRLSTTLFNISIHKNSIMQNVSENKLKHRDTTNGVYKHKQSISPENTLNINKNNNISAHPSSLHSTPSSGSLQRESKHSSLVNSPLNSLSNSLPSSGSSISEQRESQGQDSASSSNINQNPSQHSTKYIPSASLNPFIKKKHNASQQNQPILLSAHKTTQHQSNIEENAFNQKENKQSNKEKKRCTFLSNSTYCKNNGKKSNAFKHYSNENKLSKRVSNRMNEMMNTEGWSVIDSNQNESNYRSDLSQDDSSWQSNQKQVRKLNGFEKSEHKIEISKDKYNQMQNKKQLLYYQNDKKMDNFQKEAIQLAKTSKNISQFKSILIKMHLPRCGQFCTHLQRYLNNFQLYRNKKETVKMHIQNVNNHIMQNGLPLIIPKKK